MTVRCLLIDDSPAFLASAARLLESQGIDVVGSATSTREALELVAELEPNVALVDIELADEDGIALAQQLGARAPSVRVVLISAYDTADVSELIAESRAVGYAHRLAAGPHRRAFRFFGQGDGTVVALGGWGFVSLVRRLVLARVRAPSTDRAP